MNPREISGNSASRRPTDSADLHSSVARFSRQNAAQPRILVVDDNDDVRRMLALALECDGYAVDEARSAIEGLRQLEGERYNLVLSDYAMPDRTGAWMLHEAARRGLLLGTEALIVTAHPGVGDLSDVPVITKPLDLDLFLDQVRRLVAASCDDPGATNTSRVMPRKVRHRVELILYVSSSSPASIQARRNLNRLLDRFVKSQVKVTVCDLGRDPLAGEKDRVAFTPTLIKSYPEPRVLVLGNLREPGIVVDLLRACGVDSKE